MKYAYLSIAFIVFGICGIFFLIIFENVTTNNESEYYVLKEAMEAAMLESIDMACYRIGEEDGGCRENEVKIIEQKFVENFTRRFSASINGTANEYEIEFYDIIESPPKATVIIKGKTINYLNEGADDETFTIVNDLSGILELRRQD